MNIRPLKDVIEGPQKPQPVVYPHHPHLHVHCHHLSQCSCGYCYGCGRYVRTWRYWHNNYWNGVHSAVACNHH